MDSILSKELNASKFIKKSKGKPVTGLRSYRTAGGGMGSGKRGEQRKQDQYENKRVRTKNKRDVREYKITHPAEMLVKDNK